MLSFIMHDKVVFYNKKYLLIRWAGCEIFSLLDQLHFKKTSFISY